MNISLNSISNKLTNYILSKVEIEIDFKIKQNNDNHIEQIYNSDFITVDIFKDEVIVFYANESEDFWKEPYNSEEQWIQSAGDFIVLLLTHTVTIDYYYSKRTQKLLYYKTWLNKESYRRRLKTVLLTKNIFAAFQSKIIVTEFLNTII